MDFTLTARQKELQQRTREFIAQKIIPFERDNLRLRPALAARVDCLG